MKSTDQTILKADQLSVTLDGKQTLVLFNANTAIGARIMGDSLAIMLSEPSVFL